MQFTSGYGAGPGAWRLPGANLSSYADVDQFVRYAQAAERGKIQLLFFADTPVLDVDLEDQAPHFPIDPLLVMASIARETERIGLVATGSTTFNEPYNLARQFKALDVISHGRAGELQGAGARGRRRLRAGPAGVGGWVARGRGEGSGGRGCGVSPEQIPAPTLAYGFSGALAGKPGVRA
jgi:hypothetical protein